MPKIKLKANHLFWLAFFATALFYYLHSLNFLGLGDETHYGYSRFAEQALSFKAFDFEHFPGIALIMGAFMKVLPDSFLTFRLIAVFFTFLCLWTVSLFFSRSLSKFVACSLIFFSPYVFNFGVYYSPYIPLAAFSFGGLYLFQKEKPWTATICFMAGFYVLELAAPFFFCAILSEATRGKKRIKETLLFLSYVAALCGFTYLRIGRPFPHSRGSAVMGSRLRDLSLGDFTFYVGELFQYLPYALFLAVCAWIVGAWFSRRNEGPTQLLVYSIAVFVCMSCFYAFYRPFTFQSGFFVYSSAIVLLVKALEKGRLHNLAMIAIGAGSVLMSLDTFKDYKAGIKRKNHLLGLVKKHADKLHPNSCFFSFSTLENGLQDARFGYLKKPLNLRPILDHTHRGLSYAFVGKISEETEHGPEPFEFFKNHPKWKEVDFARYGDYSLHFFANESFIPSEQCPPR